MVDEKIEDVVARIERFGDRCRNAGDVSGEQKARDASARAAVARSLEESLQIERRLSGGPELVAQIMKPKKKKGFFERWFGGGSSSDSDSVFDHDTDNS